MENDSILNSVKAMLISYMDPDDDAFDTDLLIHINTVLSILFQLGVGNQEFHITGPDETWEDFLGTTKNVELVKSYIVLRVRMLFDPPTASSIGNIFDQQIKELEWRINVAVDPAHTFG